LKKTRIFWGIKNWKKILEKKTRIFLGIQNWKKIILEKKREFFGVFKIGKKDNS